MAFLDLTLGAPSMRTAARIAPALPSLSAQERQVVLLARTDPIASLDPSRLGRLARLVFGIEPPHRLADARLEALRRYAVLYRVHRAGLAAREIEHARAAGHDDGTLARVRALIDCAHGARPPRTNVPRLAAIIVALALIATVAVWTLTPVVDSPAMASVLTGVGLVTLMALAGSGGQPSAPSYR